MFALGAARRLSPLFQQASSKVHSCSRTVGLAAKPCCRGFGYQPKDNNWLTVSATSRGEDCTSRVMTGLGGHEFVVDEKSQHGGNDLGPNPLEYLLGALAGCEQVTAYYVSRKMTPEFDLNKVIVHVEGDVDPRGFKGLEETVPAHMQKVRIEVCLATSEPEERIRELQRKVELQCPVHSLFKAAGVQITSRWYKGQEIYD